MDRKSGYQSYVAPEDIELKTRYALTLNFSDRFQYVKNKVNRVDFFCACVMKMLNEHLDCVYKFYVEISNIGRLHIHGTVKFLTFRQQLKFYELLANFKDLNICTYKFGDINDELFADRHSEAEDDLDGKTYKTWDEYCKKQQVFWNNCGQEWTVIVPRETKHGDRYNDISKHFS